METHELETASDQPSDQPASDRRRPGTRRVPLDMLTALVREIAAEIDPRLDVVGVTDAGGGEGYVEMLVRMTECDREPCRVTIGVDRTLDRTALEQSLDKPLRAYLAKAA